MNAYNQGYLNKLLGFSQEVKGVDLSFKDDSLEENYKKKDINNQIKKSKILCIFISFSNIFFFAFSVIVNKKLVKNSYVYFAGFLLELILTGFAHKCSRNRKLFFFLKYLRFFIFYSLGVFTSFFQNIQRDPLSNLKLAYAMMLYVNLIYLYILEFNYIMLIGVPILNTLYLSFLKKFQYLGDFSVYSDIIAILIYYLITFFIKKEDHSNRKLVFFESYKNYNYIEYTKNLIEVINNMVISLKRDEILFINNYTINYLEKNILSEVTDCFSNENKDNSYFRSRKLSYFNIYLRTNLFFKSLKLTCSFNKKFSVGKDLLEIIIDLFSQEDEASKNFSRIGYFTSNNEGQYQYFDVYIRKLKFKDDIIEILIYDNTEIKQAEKTNIESKYKQKILGKIAHEFKTPLITIMSLISRIMNSNVDTNLVTKTHLNHINNLSNYVLSLISDIIQYVSNCTDIRINKCEIYLKEVLEFSFNVLKTLVECNENKNTQIKTELQIDQSLEDVRINTDEHRLKQILLNFISNAVKFTLSGSIILKAKLKNECIEISVKDTGLGIKDDDKHLIFQENIQLDVNHEYNTRGSGLGLSITKNLANFLHISIGFNSIYSKGSKFFIIFNDFMKKKFKSLNTDIPLELSQEYKPLDILPSNKSKSIHFFEEENRVTPKCSFDLIKVLARQNSLEQDSRIEIEQSIRFSLKQKETERDLILVIDDHKLVRENTVSLIKNVLSSLHYENFEIIEGSDGIDLLYLIRKDRNGRIKYIFCDENMEYLNGSDAVKITRNLEACKKISKYLIVSITAFDDSESRKRIISCGFDLVINKPCTKSVISDILSTYQAED